MNVLQLNLVLLKKLLILAVVMFAFGYAMIPFYKQICEVAGLNNLLQPDTLAEETQLVDTSRMLTVQLDANTRGLPWEFKPLQSTVQIHPGELVEVMYEIKNNSEREIIGQAIPSYAPLLVSQYIKKLECFCFVKQAFNPNEEVEMTLRFVIEPEMEERIKDVSLSYNFYKLDS